MTIHYKIIDLLRSKYKEDPCVLGSSLLSMSDEDMIRSIFINCRNTSDGLKGLRIHGEAELLLSYYFDSYKIPLDMVIEKPSHVVFLDRVTTMPWYFNPKELILFEKELAMRARIVGDLDSLIEGFEDYTTKSVITAHRKEAK